MAQAEEEKNRRMRDENEYECTFRLTDSEKTVSIKIVSSPGRCLVASILYNFSRLTLQNAACLRLSNHSFSYLGRNEISRIQGEGKGETLLVGQVKG